MPVDVSFKWDKLRFFNFSTKAHLRFWLVSSRQKLIRSWQHQQLRSVSRVDVQLTYGALLLHLVNSHFEKKNQGNNLNKRFPLFRGGSSAAEWAPKVLQQQVHITSITYVHDEQTPFSNVMFPIFSIRLLHVVSYMFFFLSEGVQQNQLGLGLSITKTHQGR